MYDNDFIFVNIVSYRETDICSTLENLLTNAHDESRLRFGILWQYDSRSEIPEKYLTDARFTIKHMHYSQAKGNCGWARWITSQMHNNERYYYMIDAHMRFVEHWDKHLIEMMEEIGYGKTIISHTCENFMIQDDGSEIFDREDEVPITILTRFDEHGYVLWGPYRSPKVDNFPTPNRYMSLHNFFAPGQWVKDVPHDPEIYYSNEEFCVMLRTYTSGYNVWFPSFPICWHKYFTGEIGDSDGGGQHPKIRHWDDERGEADRLEKVSRKRFQHMFFGWHDDVDLGIYGLGKERSLEQYSRFSGMDLKNKVATQDCYDGIPPTIDMIDGDINVR